MIELSPNSRVLCHDFGPIFMLFGQMRSLFVQMRSPLTRSPTPNPCSLLPVLYSAETHLFRRYVHIQHVPHPPQNIW